MDNKINEKIPTLNDINIIVKSKNKKMKDLIAVYDKNKSYFYKAFKNNIESEINRIKNIADKL